jgi:hypothetical protein
MDMNIDLTKLYFARQLLHPTTRVASPLEVARKICGINAQRGPTVYLSCWNRITHFRKEELDAALYETKTLVKTWCMRGTVHVIPSDEVYLYLKAVSHAWSREITDAFKNVCMKVTDVLEEPSTKSEIKDRIRGKTDVAEKDLNIWVSRAVRFLGYTGQVVYGTPIGKGITIRTCTFVRTDCWLPVADSYSYLSQGEARQDLAAQYVSCYGPAAVQDFAYWAGLKVGEARTAFDSAGCLEFPMESSQRRYFVKAGDTCAMPYEEGNISLLPQYDSYVMGHKFKSRILEEEHKSRVFLPLAEVAAVILKDGFIIGTWQMKKDGDSYLFRVDTFTDFEGSEMSSIIEKIDEMAHFLGTDDYEIR